MGGRRLSNQTQQYYVCCRFYLKYDAGKNQSVCLFQRYVRSCVIEARVAQALTDACLKPAITRMAIHDFYTAAAADVRGDVIEREREVLLDREEHLSRRLRSIRQSMADVRAEDEEANVSGFAKDYARSGGTG